MSDPRQLVLTEAEPAPPPDVTVPEPAPTPHGPALAEIKALADRVGGLEALRYLVDRLFKAGQHDRA